jgi:hypothetical protein
MGGIKGNSGELSDLIWGNCDGRGRQVHATYDGGSPGIRQIARIDDHGSQEREAKDCHPLS